MDLPGVEGQKKRLDWSGSQDKQAAPATPELCPREVAWEGGGGRNLAPFPYKAGSGAPTG